VFDVGLGEIAVLLLAGLFVFGPDRLPSVVAQAARTIRQIRDLAAGARTEITEAIGPELRDLNPMAALTQAGEEFGDLRDLTPRKFLNNAMFGAGDKVSPPASGAAATDPVAGGSAVAATEPSAAPSAAPAPPPAFDADAT
jgi:sec-independent protein translocase protein TatB